MFGWHGRAARHHGHSQKNRNHPTRNHEFDCLEKSSRLGTPDAAGRCLFSRLPPGFPVVPLSRPYISCTPAPHRTGQAAFPHPALHSNIQLRAKRVHVRFRHLSVFDLCSQCAHALNRVCVSSCTDVRARELHSTGISRFIATIPSRYERPHLNHSCYVAHAYSGPEAQEGLCTPGLLHDCSRLDAV